MINCKEIIKFITVGIGNTILGVVLIFLFYSILGLGYWISTALAYIIGGFFSFFANKVFTFQSKGSLLRQILKFFPNLLICYSIGYGLAKPIIRLLIIYFMPQFETYSEKLAIVLGMVLYTVLNYFGQKCWCFSKKDEE